jgi:hypothetical protein
MDNLSFSGANVKRTEIPRSGITASGYGRKLATSIMVWHLGYWRRVYCICFSNAGTLYIRVNGERVILHDYQIDTDHADSMTQEVR